MYYIMYLTNLCNRRRWPDPSFDVRQTRSGYTCRVRVNNREYTSADNACYSSSEQAQEKAAESAYMICRNFSVNDGMYPGQKQGQAGVTQGLPVAIGTGRKSKHHGGSSSSKGKHGGSAVGSVYGGGYGGSSSGSSSPRSMESEYDDARQQGVGSVPAVCYCQRGYVMHYQQCEHCLREAGWRV